MNNIEEKARSVAQKAHEGQFRKDGSPFFEHPEKVAAILKFHNYRPELVAAGFLHDVVEDTSVTAADLNEIEEFKGNVMQYVLANTEDKRKPWLERKQHTHNSIPNLPIEERALIAADKLANLMDISKQQHVIENYWSLFNADYAAQRWYYLGVALSLFVYLTPKEIEENPLFTKYFNSAQEVFLPKK